LGCEHKDEHRSARAFTQQFGQSPQQFRIRANQERTLRPEIQRLAKAG
jgi:hypothetical protein